MIRKRYDSSRRLIPGAVFSRKSYWTLRARTSDNDSRVESRYWEDTIMLNRALAAASFFALALSASPSMAAGKTMCFVTFSLQIAYFQSSVAGGQKAAKELGVDLVVLDAQADAGRQVTMVEDCLGRNVNAIVVDPI